MKKQATPMGSASKRPAIGDRAACAGDDGVIWHGTIMDLRPMCGVCGDWHDSGERPHSFANGMVSEPFGAGKTLAFVASPGWPHMHVVALTGAEVKSEGVWRARPREKSVS